MSSVSAAVGRRVKERARELCQFCRMHQSLHGATFHIEHVIPLSAGGNNELSNLVLACPSCNLHKTNRVEAAGPQSGKNVPLFHPLAERWGEHFEWQEFLIAGRTAIGRSTVEALRFNDPRRVKIRQAEALFDLFPP